MTQKQNEILTPVSVLNDQGIPRNFGWSRQPGFFYDPALVWAPRRRLSESDRYIVFCPSHLVIFEIADEGYMSCLGVSVISLTDKKRSTHIFRSLFSLGSMELPPGSETGAIKYRRKN